MSQSQKADCLILKALNHQVEAAKGLKEPSDLKKIAGAMFYFPVNRIKDTPLIECKKGAVVTIDYEHNFKLNFKNLKCEILDDNVKKVEPAIIVKPPEVSNNGSSEEENYEKSEGDSEEDSDDEDSEYEEFSKGIKENESSKHDISSQVSESFDLISLKGESSAPAASSSIIDSTTVGTADSLHHNLPDSATQTSTQEDVLEEKLLRIINQNDQIIKDQNDISKNLSSLVSIFNEKAMRSTQVTQVNESNLATQDRFLTPTQDLIITSGASAYPSTVSQVREEMVLGDSDDFLSHEERYYSELVSRLKSRLPKNVIDRRMIELKRLYPDIISEIRREVDKYVPPGENAAQYWQRALTKIRKRRYRKMLSDLKRRLLNKSLNK